jgi:hypothetical protein
MPCRRTSEHFGPFHRKLPEELPLKPAEPAFCRDASTRAFRFMSAGTVATTGIRTVLDGRDVLGRDCVQILNTQRS